MTSLNTTGQIRILLASASPARAETLRKAGARFSIQVSGVDEDQVAQQLGPVSPAQLALELARAKALDVAQTYLSGQAQDRPAAQETVVIVGCDSVLESGGVAHGKPGSGDVAAERLRALSGSQGTLHTGHWLVRLNPGAGTGDLEQVGATESTIVHFATLSEADIAAYVATGEPLHVAGSFTIDGRGGAFVRAIEGDVHNVVGISLPRVRLLLADLGLSWTDVWL